MARLAAAQNGTEAPYDPTDRRADLPLRRQKQKLYECMDSLW
jgi:hypothetical protein